MPKTCLVTGSKGLLGTKVVDAFQKEGWEVVGVDLPDHDLTDEPQTAALFDSAKPSHVVHCAAFTNVDGAESDPNTCRKINVGITRTVSKYSEMTGARLVLISTDFVFDGKKTTPYVPDDEPNPLGVYARTKLEAEQVVASMVSRHQIVRTAWMFGPGKRNFVTAILDQLKQGKNPRVVNDQFGCPTYAPDLAEHLVPFAECEETGVYHLVNSGSGSWCDLARAAARLAGYDPARVQGIFTDLWPTPALRPEYSVLDCSKTSDLGIGPMRPWEEALAEYIGVLKADK